MRLLNHDPAAAWEAWNANQPDTTGSIWHEQDPYNTDVSFHGFISYG
jgi:hypothetical protein